MINGDIAARWPWATTTGTPTSSFGAEARRQDSVPAPPVFAARPSFGRCSVSAFVSVVGRVPVRSFGDRSRATLGGRGISRVLLRRSCGRCRRRARRIRQGLARLRATWTMVGLRIGWLKAVKRLRVLKSCRVVRAGCVRRRGRTWSRPGRLGFLERTGLGAPRRGRGRRCESRGDAGRPRSPPGARRR